ncbi:MAG: hypothetical protein HY587_07640 [Candidatus Omnitrophica bacterium]|nr:hypothetical protein [Candidatus Omnitrophota bacterium]
MFTNTLRVLKKSPASDWSVILNPIHSEIAKNEAVQKIVEVFPITASEAEELVERTPLILLESLSEEDAHRVREHFARANVDLMVSVDATLRRRCYRTVWPERPSLDFIKRVESSPAVSEDDFLRKDEPRRETPVNNSRPATLERSPVDRSKPTLTDNGYFKSVPKKIEKSDFARRYAFEETPPEARYSAERLPMPERDSLIDELKDRLLGMQRKASEAEEENRRLRLSLEKLEKEKNEQMAANGLETQRRSFDSLSFEYEKKQVLLEEKVEQLIDERDQLIDDLSRVRSRLGEVETEKNRLSSEQESVLKKLAFREQELEQIKVVVDRQQRLEEENKQLRLRYEDLAQESEERYKRFREMEGESRAAEMRAQQLTDEVQRLKKEFEEEHARVREEVDLLRRRAKEFEVVKAENKSMQEELRVARDRLKEFTINREQQEAIAKRLRLQNELIEKEARLKELVKKQEIIEREIVERGQVIQQVLTEQEEIEREIVRAKQAQKYITEQIKSREKPHLRTRGRLEVKSPEALNEVGEDM